MGVRHDGPFTAVDDLELVALCRTHRVNVNRLHGARRTAARSSTRTTATVRTTPAEPLPGEPGFHQLRCAAPNRVLVHRSDTPANPRRTAEIDQTLTNR